MKDCTTTILVWSPFNFGNTGAADVVVNFFQAPVLIACGILYLETKIAKRHRLSTEPRSESVSTASQHDKPGGTLDLWV
jgi:hypothetical protein